MASRLDQRGNGCEAEGCSAASGLAYWVREKKILCDNCASNKNYVIKTARQNELGMFCDKHKEPVRLYCKTHDIAVCILCANIDHHQPSCVRQDVEEAIAENKAKLKSLSRDVKDKTRLWQECGSQLQRCKIDVDTHLTSVKANINAVINTAIKEVNEKEQEGEAAINQRADEEIRKINETREANLKKNRDDAEKKRAPMEEKRGGLVLELQNFGKVVETKTSKLEKLSKEFMKDIENTSLMIDEMLSDDQKLVNGVRHASALITDVLGKPMDEDEVGRITRTVSSVRFVKGAGDEKYNGRIDYEGEWQLVDSIELRDFSTPFIAGLIDHCNVIMSHKSRSTYIINLNSRAIEKVVTTDDNSIIVSCASLNDDTVVCGKYCKGCTGDTLDRCISLYDRRWKLIKNIAIPRNTKKDSAGVEVAVDQDGMIIAAEGFQTKIYIINSANGNIVNTITCKDNVILRGALSSGHIVALLPGTLLIVDRDGGQLEIPYKSKIINCAVDPLTDDLYVVTSDIEYKACVIGQLSRGRDTTGKRVASFVLSSSLGEKINDNISYLVQSRLVMSPSQLIACDGEKIMVFKKTLCA